MTAKTCALIGAPVQSGTGRRGCIMGPDAYRAAGLIETLEALGHRVEDRGTPPAEIGSEQIHTNPAVHHLAEVAGWTRALQDAAYDAARTADVPIFLGGDHSISLGTVSGVARHAADLGQPQFVLWVDAHPDIHTLESTESGNLHGTPVAYFTGIGSFPDPFPSVPAPVEPVNVTMLGLRSVDPAEHDALLANGVDVHDMRAIDEAGIVTPLRAFLDRVAAAGGRLHVSLDVDFLDPGIAPAVGTTVPGGATFREAHLVMEMVCDSGLLTSLDLVELNPFLDERGRTATLMVDLTASALGRKVLDRPTRRY